MDQSAPETKPEPASTSAPDQPDEYVPSKGGKGKFRFKHSTSSSHRSRHHPHYPPPDSHSNRHKRRHRERGSDKPTKRRRHHTPPTPAAQNGVPPLSPDIAFRESLFDALGDDEGAAYWESVYGQPIHTYPVPNVPKGPDGELERMTEEEYATYVRTRMWEKTREGMIEEQERLRAERKHAQAEQDRARDYRESARGWRRAQNTQHKSQEERQAFEKAMDESLRRGAERKKRKTWEGIWAEYVRRWDEIGGMVSSTHGENGKDSHPETKPLRNLLFWPVESGKRKDVSAQSVKDFMRHAPTQDDLLATLKAERIRWHPDKMQHRYGALGIDGGLMRGITEVFQILDRMWSEEKERPAADTW